MNWPSAAVGILLFPALVVAAESGVSPNHLKLPKGPGSLEGIGENAEPNLSMGLATYGISIEVPPGHGGLAPSLRLSYSSGSGQSVVGLGWSFGPPTINRMTSRGLPKYGASDLFEAGGGEELVRVPGTNVFRARYEGSFVRYTWFDVSGLGQHGYWKAEYPDGKVGYFGATSVGTTVAASRVESSAGTFSYGLVELHDTLGHRVGYSYQKHEHQPYLSEVAWGHAQNATPRYSVLLTYEDREDEQSNGKPGFDLRLQKRLTAVAVLVRGDLLRRYALAHEPYHFAGGQSRLASVTIVGSDGLTEHPVKHTFFYSGAFDPACENQSACNLPTLVAMGSVGTAFGTGLAALVDMNSDGLPDVVDTTGGRHLIYLNAGNAFAPPLDSLTAGSGAMVLSSNRVHLFDLDGDGDSDMVDGLNSNVLWNRGHGDWQAENFAATTLPDFGADADLRFLDVNNDRSIDCIHSDGSETWAYLNRGDGSFETNALLLEDLGWGFQADGLQLADMNGDGLQDIVLPMLGAVSYRMNLGHGVFTTPIDMFGVPETLAPADMQLVDLNGDGLADVVAVLGTEINFNLNLSGLSFAEQQTISQTDGGAIPQRDSSVSVQFADMNGSGSTDVVWIDSSGHVTFLDIFPKRPNLLSRIENSIGRVIELHYGSTLNHMARDGGPAAWTHRLPHPMLTLDKIESYDTLSLVHQVREFHYRDGYYDGVEKQFRGFTKVLVLTPGDSQVESGRRELEFDVGTTDPYRKALLLREAFFSNERELSEQTSTYEDCAVTGAPTVNALPVRYLCKRSDHKVLKEGGPESTWVTIDTSLDYDGFGNVTFEGHYGVTCGSQCLGDERFVETQYVPLAAANGRWMVKTPFRKKTYGVEGGETTDEVTYFDGDDFVGLSAGQLTHGLVKRVTQKVSHNSPAIIQTQRNAHDTHGNVTEVRDANGNVRTVGYDVDGLLATHEEAHVAVPSPYRLRQEVSHHPLYEQVTESTSWMLYQDTSTQSARRSTFYGYDVLSRLTSIAQPGDSLDKPTQEFEYLLADPISAIVTRTRKIVGEDEPSLVSAKCFDGLGRELQTRTRIDASLVQVTGFVEHDAHGHPWRQFQPYRATTLDCDTAAPAAALYTQTSHDAQGRNVSMLAPDEALYDGATTTRWQYTPLATTLYDGEDNAISGLHFDTPTLERVDGLGRKIQVLRTLAPSALPISVRFTYDELGRLSGTVDDAGNQKVQTYDLLGRVLSVRDPDTGVSTFEHDAVGNVIRSTDARGFTTKHAYDSLNRATATWDEAQPEETRVTFTYDRVPDCALCTFVEGQLARVTYPLAPIFDGQWASDENGYDARGRHISFSRRLLKGVFTLSYAYDNADRLTGTTFPTGEFVSYTVDGADRVTTISGFVDAVEYTARNQPQSLLLANATQTTYAYDAVMRLSGLTTQSASGGLLLGYTYERDRVGNIVQVTDARSQPPSGDAAYSYDSLYRLTSAVLDSGTPSGETLTYGYNRIDNILFKQSDVGTGSASHIGNYTYDGAGPHAVTRAGTTSLVYDAAGNVTRRGNATFSWDYRGRLVSVSEGARALTRYAYGTDRQRVAKREGSDITLYISDDFEVRNGVGVFYVTVGGQRVVKIEGGEFGLALFDDLAPANNEDGELNAADADQAVQQVRSTDEILAMLVASAQQTLVGERQVTYWHNNHLGTTSATTNDLGVLVQRFEHDPHGEPRYVSSAPLETYSWTGQERDASVGLSYHSARYLDTRLGRWISADPLFVVAGEKSVKQPWEAANLYGYVANNPINFLDPDGQEITVARSLDAAGVWQTRINFTAVVVNNSATPLTPAQMRSTANAIKSSIERAYTKTWAGGRENLVTTANVLSAMPAAGPGSRHEISLETIVAGTPGVLGRANFGKTKIQLLAGLANGAAPAPATLGRTAAHEFGHSATLRHPNDPVNPLGLPTSNLMSQTALSTSRNVTFNQVLQIHQAYKTGGLNQP